LKRETRSIGEAVFQNTLWWRVSITSTISWRRMRTQIHMDGLNDVARNFSVRAALVARDSR